MISIKDPIRRKRKVTEETKTKTLIKKFLKSKNIFHHSNTQGIGSYPGIPDITCITGGKYIGIEVKSQGGKLSDNQEIFRDNLEMSGGIYIVARSVDDVMEFFKT